MLSSEDTTYQLPNNFSLSQNFPNPFNPMTTIEYIIPENNEVQITIFDSSGRLIKNLFNGKQSRGQNKIVWNARNNKNQPVPSGIYLYKIQAGEFSKTKKWRKKYRWKHPLDFQPLRIFLNIIFNIIWHFR